MVRNGQFWICFGGRANRICSWLGDGDMREGAREGSEAFRLSTRRTEYTGHLVGGRRLGATGLGSAQEFIRVAL